MLGQPQLLLLGVHIRAEDGVDAGLVAALLAEPAEQVGVEAHGDDLFGRGQDDRGIFPEGGIGGVGIGVGEKAAADGGGGLAAQALPVCTARAFLTRSARFRFLASSGGVRAARSARPR